MNRDTRRPLKYMASDVNRTYQALTDKPEVNVFLQWEGSPFRRQPANL
jgi:hypothetical protein